MKKIYFVFLFSTLINGQLKADEAGFQHCQNLASLYGHHATPQTVPVSCREKVLQYSPPLAQIQNADGTRGMLAANGMIYIDHYQDQVLVKSELLAGENAKLGEVLAIDFDEENHHLFVLSRHGDGVSFAHHDINFIGNTAPLRSYKSSDLLGVVSFRIDTQPKEIYLLDQGQLAIKVYHLYADVHGRMPEHNTEMLRSIQGEQTQILNPVDLALSADEIFLLEADRVQVYAKSANGNIVPSRSIAGVNTGINNAKMINLDLANQEIIIKNGNDQNLRFSLQAHGDVAPKLPH